MFEDMIVQDEPVLMPHWAVGTTNKYLTLGAQLCTRDGRKIGNAVVVELVTIPVFALGDVEGAWILTDMGNKVLLTEGELREWFYRPKWIMNLNERMQKGHCEPVYSDQ